jgi:hypothetical protein
MSSNRVVDLLYLDVMPTEEDREIFARFLDGSMLTDPEKIRQLVMGTERTKLEPDVLAVVVAAGQRAKEVPWREGIQKRMQVEFARVQERIDEIEGSLRIGDLLLEMTFDVISDEEKTEALHTRAKVKTLLDSLKNEQVCMAASIGLAQNMIRKFERIADAEAYRASQVPKEARN